MVGEELEKIDQTFEATIDRLNGHLRALGAAFPSEPTPSDYPPLLDDQPFQMEPYLIEWRWNGMKYRTDQSVKDIAEALAAEVGQMDNLVKSKMNLFSQSKSEIDTFNKSKT